MNARYIREGSKEPSLLEGIAKRCSWLYDIEIACKYERLRLQGLLEDVSMIHTGEVIEIDKELLAEDPEAYCVKVRNYSNGRIEYLTKAQLRK